MKSSNSEGWSDIETLRVIFKHCFPFVEKLKFKSVCRSWRATAEFEIKLLVTQLNSPLLLLPRADNNFPISGYGYGYTRKNSCKILYLENNKYLGALPQRPPRNKLVMPESNHIVGSCRGGWLLLMKKTSTLISLLSLWNPRFDVQIHLPNCVRCRAPDLRITKAALVGSDNPLVNSTDYGVVIMYSDGNIAFAKQGDTGWRNLGDGKGKPYLDVTSSENFIIALSYFDQLDHQIEIWKFITNTNTNTKTDDNNSSSDDETVVKTMKISVRRPSSAAGNMPEAEKPLNYKFSSQLYILQEGGGRVLLVVRWIGNFVDENGKLWTEDELIEEEEEAELMMCSYKTMNFYVFELDTEKNKWVRVRKLGNDQVLFVGGNQAVSWRASNPTTMDDESCCIFKNSIYFTDDSWDRMEDHDGYGGHDNGIFTLEDGNIRQIFPFYLDKISPPFLVLP